MKIYLALIIFIFVGCAAQMAPKGGSVDTNGPNLIKVSHMPTSNIAGTTDKIIFYFDEDIDPISVVNAIDVLNFDEFNYQIRGDKIIIKPFHQWPTQDIIKVSISRKISDFHNNNMDSHIQYPFLNSLNISNKQITGNLINTHDDLFQIGLYQLDDNDYRLIDKIEPNINGLFQFKYLDDGKYIAVAVEDKIDSLSYDIRNKRYGFINSNFIDLINNDSINITIRIDNPLERLSIKSFRQVNNNFGYVMLNNGLEKPFIFPSDSMPLDSLDIIIQLKNRIESYSTPIFSTVLNNVIDTLAPKLDFYEYIDDRLYISFNEPISRGIKSPNTYYFLDSIMHPIKYNFINSFTIQIDSIINNELYIENIYDTYSNKSKDTLSIKNQRIITQDNQTIGGNIYGSIDYNGQFPIIVKAEHIDQKYIYYNYTDSSNQFYFSNIMPGFYNFSAYEILGNYDSTQYYQGSWKPFKRASKFGIYDEILEVRDHWDIKDMIIKIK